MVERRALVRHKTFFKGRIYFNNRLSSMDCMIRDVTANGGRIEVSDSVALPNTFEIYLPNKDEYFNAKVVWRRGGSLGISWSQEQFSRQKPEHGDSQHAIADRLARLEHEVARLHKRLDALQDP
jgi:hypothetical protein